MPDGRTIEYFLMRCCERWRLIPPSFQHNNNGIDYSINQPCWDTLNLEQQALLIAYEQIRQREENKELELLVTAGIRKSITL